MSLTPFRHGDGLLQVLDFGLMDSLQVLGKGPEGLCQGGACGGRGAGGKFARQPAADRVGGQCGEAVYE